VSQMLKYEMEARHYTLDEIRLSKFLERGYICYQTPICNNNEHDRLNSLMDRGNELRNLSGSNEILALLASAEINSKRPEEMPFLSGSSFLLRQLKHPDEVLWLRKIYGSAFHLIGVYSSETSRRNNLNRHCGMNSEQVQQVIERDEGEEEEYGQKLRDTFYLADFFIEEVGDGQEVVANQLKRYLNLLFAEGMVSPTKDEYGMQLAYTAALRSTDLARQVGAAILNSYGEVVSIGANEVPAPGGGQYWGDSGEDHRDFKEGYDSNVKKIREILSELLSIIEKEYETELSEITPSKLKGTQFMNITEYGRSVHAEMEALLSAGRIGSSTKGCILYTTTFPCHNCAKHIVGAGIKRVVYIEPYPKSLAKDLHHDAIVFPENDNANSSKVRFEPFVGVAPKKYWILFSNQSVEGEKLERKDKEGNFVNAPLGLRLKAPSFTYIDRELSAAGAIRTVLENWTLDNEKEEDK
ncbi:MAG: dCMP deaminase family protein, partial [Bacteroidales bacterium]|nr:dCMP deaminase family protein [Bacteroidales bacterium]